MKPRKRQEFRLSWIAVALLELTAGAASAATTQPNGTVVPIVNAGEDVNTVENHGRHSTLELLFSSRGETIDSQMDAHTTPSVFSPRCNFTGTLVLHSAGCQMDFGWYNVDLHSSAAPTDDQVFLLVPRDANASYFPLVGDTGLSTFLSEDILADPRYRGGLIGFAIKNSRQGDCPQSHYSEVRLNPLCSDESGRCQGPSGVHPAAPWIMALSYQSTVSTNAYYLAFEDQNPGMSDGDFNDDVYFITGIACPGAGESCATGRLGACGPGIQQCSKAGALTCVATNAPTGELCDGVDNDCNGVADDGNTLCPSGQICSRGACVTSCAGATCAEGKVCTVGGVCGDPACQAVDCPAGKQCSSGTCASPCDGITCPVGQACRAGACIDACLGVRCEGGFECIDGTCQQGCTCLGCPSGTSCGNDGRCVVDACKDVTCAAGTTCNAGVCVDRCTGAVCPAGQTCAEGSCLDMCAGATCPKEQKCVAGACVDRCDGVTCATGQMCVAGVCVDTCSLTCTADKVCRQGVCTDPCANVTCPAGSACKWGACQDACVGVTCAAGQKCVSGACIDACSGIGCAANEVCVAGACWATCATTACPMGQTCVDAVCVDACAGVMCAAGTACSAGTCVDACALKTCPNGCAEGQCIAPDGGDADGSDASADGPAPAAKSGCGCELGGTNATGGLLGLVLAVAALARSRRRRAEHAVRPRSF